MCLAFGVERLDDIGAAVGEILELQPPEGLAAKVRGLRTLKSIADARPKVVRRGACQEIVLTGDDVDLTRLPVQTAWPGDAGPFITLPAVITRDPRNGQRNVGMYRMQVLGPRSTAMHWQIHKDGRADYLFSEGRMEVAVALGLDPDHRVLRERAAAEAHRRVHGRRIPARRGRRAGQGRHDRPRGAGGCRDRARGLHREERADAGRAVRRPHRLLHAGRGVPGLQRHRDHDAQGRDLSVDRRRQAAAGGRLARQGDRAHLPAGGADDRPRDRRLRPAGRGRVPQPRDRLDQEGVPGARAQGDARDLGPRDAQPDEGDRDRRRARRRARLRRGHVLRRRERRPEAGHRDHRGPARPPRPRADAAVHRRQDRDRRDRQGAARGRARVAAGDRDGRRDEGARRPALGGIWTRDGSPAANGRIRQSSRRLLRR